MPRFLKPNIGNRRPRLRAVSYTVGSAFPVIRSIWGFGSFLRPGSFSDIDLLVIVSCGQKQLLGIFTQVRASLELRTSYWGFPVDILFLTEREARGRPLRDMHLLEPLFQRRAVNRLTGPFPSPSRSFI